MDNKLGLFKLAKVQVFRISFENLKNNAVNYINQYIGSNQIQEDMQGKNEEPQEEATENATTSQEANENPVLGATEENLYVEDASSISQIEDEAYYIKNNYSFIKPLNRNNYI